MNSLKKGLDWTYRIIEYFSMAMVVVMTVIISAQVFCRYFLNFTPGWTEEVALVLLVWITSIGFSIGVYKGLHLSIELFVRSLPKQVKIVIYVIDELVIIFFGYVVLRYGMELAQRMSTSTLAATQWPGSTLYIMMPISAVFMIAFAVANIFEVKTNVEKSTTIDLEEV